VAVAEVVATETTFLDEPAVFEGALFGDVVDLGAGPDAVGSGRGER
jgi:hypothetical protein